MAKKAEKNPAKTVESLFNKVANLIEQARVRVATAMNVAEVYTKYQIGRYIVEEEQSGNVRAEYGKQVLEGLSERLTAQYGDGWSYSNLRQIRQFFQVYSNLIIKNPVTLELAGLKPDASYSESNLEPAIIGKMQMYINY